MMQKWPCLGSAFCLLLLILAGLPGPGRCSPFTAGSSGEPQTVAPGDGESFLFEEPPAEGSENAADNAEADDCGPATDLREKPLVAIIIDDMGYHRRIGQALLAIDLNLTFSFLPHAPYTKEQAEQAWRRGRDILVHMPMEPRDPTWNAGPGTLYLDDAPEVRSAKIAANLAGVPRAVGVNNHMGSLYTADRPAMTELLEHIRGQGLLFVDSITSPESVARATARELGVRSAQRHVFLDNIQSEDDICRQLQKLVARAGRRGSAVGIGHPNRATLTALQNCRQMLQSRVRVVGIRELAR
jgi:polysaccharide deacetylase 2 family uncharacterized protein YibQ